MVLRRRSLIGCTAQNTRHRVRVCADVFCDANASPLLFVQAVDHVDLGVREASVLRVMHRDQSVVDSVLNVLGWRHKLQVVQLVVALVAVLVIDLHAVWDVAGESEPHGAMGKASVTYPATREGDSVVGLSLVGTTNFFERAWSPHRVRMGSLAFDAPVRVDTKSVFLDSFLNDRARGRLHTDGYTTMVLDTRVPLLEG